MQKKYKWSIPLSGVYTFESDKGRLNVDDFLDEYENILEDMEKLRKSVVFEYTKSKRKNNE